MAIQIQLRRDTAANWTSVNPILAAGEEGYETDTGKRKIGDGSTPWAGLPYASLGLPTLQIAAGGNTASSGTLQFSNSNGVTFGIAGSTLTASVVNTIALYASSNTTQSSTGTVDPRSFSVAGAGIISVGFTNGGLLISASGGGAGQVNFSAGSTSQNLSAITFSNGSGVSFGLAGSVLTASVGAGVGPGSLSAGTTTVALGQAVFSNANGVSFGLAGSTMTASIASQSGQGISAAGGSSTFQTLVFTNSNNVSFTNTGGSVAGSFALNASAGAGTSNALSGLTFANSNGVTFGLSTGAGVGTLTASYSVPSIAGLISAVNISAGSTSNNLSALTFSNGNGVTFGMAGSVITASIPAVGGAQTGVSGLQVSNTTYTSGTITFVNANGVSFGSSGANGISASFGQSAQSIAVYVTTQSVGQSSSSTADARSFSMQGAGIVSMGWSNSTLMVSATQSNQSAGIYAVSQTTGAASSSTHDARSLSIAGAGNVSVGWSNSSLVISGVGGAAVNVAGGTQTATSGTVVFSNANGISFGLSNSSVMTASYSVPSVAGLITGIGLSAGAGLTNGTGLTFSNANGVSFGLAGLTLTGSIAAYPAQTNQTIGLYAGSNTTQGTSGTVDARSMTLAGAGAVSVGVTGNSVVISAAAGAQSVQTVGVYAASWTTGAASSSTYDARSLNIQGAGIISVGNSGGSILISGPASSAISLLSVGMSTNGNTQGNTGLGSNQVVFVGSNNITLSGSTNGGSMTIAVIGAAGGGGTGGVGLSAGSQSVNTGTVIFANSNGFGFGMSGSSQVTANVTQTMSLSGNTNAATTTWSGNAMGLSAAGALTINTAGAGQFQFSAPAVSSLVGAGGINVSTVGSTISISYTGGVGAGINLAAGTQTATGGTVVFSNSNGVTFGLSGSVVTASVAGGGGGGGTLSAGTTQVALGQAVFSNSNGVSFGLNGSTITASVLSQSVQTVGLAVSAPGGGGAGTLPLNTNSTLVFSNGPGGVGLVNITFSVSTTAGYLAVRGYGPTIFTNSQYVIGNTIGAATSTIIQNSPYSYSGIGGVSIGFSNAALQISAPQTSSLLGSGGVSIFTTGSSIYFQGPATSYLVGTNGVFVSVVGNTISVGLTGGALGTQSIYNPYACYNVTDNIAGSNNVLTVQNMINLPVAINVSRFEIPVNFAALTTNSTNAVSAAWTVMAAIYTRTVSTLSLVTSASQSYSASINSTNGYSSQFDGTRVFTIPMSFTNVGQGDYWFAFQSSVAGSATNSNQTLCAALQKFGPDFDEVIGVVGQGVTLPARVIPIFGYGQYTTTTPAPPSSIAASQLANAFIGGNVFWAVNVLGT